MRRIPSRWRTPFGRFVESVGVEHLVHQLGAAGQPVTRYAVYHWLSGQRVPRPERVAELVRMSGGALTFEHVYEHRTLVSTTRRE